MNYDPNESQFPPIGEPVRVLIGDCEERQASSGRDMLLLNLTVCDGQPGHGFESRFYALSFHLGDIMRAVGMDASGPRTVNATTFRNKAATVTFKQEPYTNKDGEAKTATKVDQWIPATDPAPEAVTTYIAEDGTSRVNPNDDDIPF